MEQKISYINYNMKKIVKNNIKIKKRIRKEKKKKLKL